MTFADGCVVHNGYHVCQRARRATIMASVKYHVQWSAPQHEGNQGYSTSEPSPSVPLFLYLSFSNLSFCTSLFWTSVSVPLSVPLFLYLSFMYLSFCTSLYLYFYSFLSVLLFLYFSFVTSLLLLLFFYFSFPNQVGNGFTEIINAGGITEQTTNFTFNLGMDDQCGIWYSNINKCKA